MGTKQLTHTFTPRNACKTMFESNVGEVLLSGPAGTGKSRACMEKMNALALLFPRMRGLMLRKTMVSLASSVVPDWEDSVVHELMRNGTVTYFGGSTREPPCYKYRNGSRVVLGGMDNPIKIMSTQYDVIYAQEAIELSENDWESCTIRLRNGRVPYQQLIADTNPDADTHWLNVRGQTGQTLVLESRHEDNPRYFNDDGSMTKEGIAYMANLDALTGVRKLRYRYGKWVGAEGMIYEDWDTAVHLIDRFDIPDSWVRYWSVDFGFTNPFVLQCWAEDPDGRLYLYREIYHTQRLVEDHAETILDIVAPEDESGKRVWTEPRPRAIVCDHDAEDRATLERKLGMPTVAAKKTVSDGIQAVQTRLKRAGDGKPRLFVLKDSVVRRDQALVKAKKPTCTAEEVPGYIWKPPTLGQPPKEEPDKKNDHGCDGKRYIVAHRDLNSGAGRARVLNPNAVRRKHRVSAA